MKTRCRSHLLIIALLSLCVTILPALSEQAHADELRPTATATLVSSTGQIETITLEEITAPYRNASAEQSKTYEASVYTARNSNLTLSANDTDSSLSARAYITIGYEKTSDDYVLLKQVSGRWTILDQSVTAGKLAKVNYGCTSAFVGSKQARQMSVTNNFGFTTGFSEMVPISAGTMGANLTVNLSHGSSNWSFTVDATLMNNMPGM